MVLNVQWVGFNPRCHWPCCDEKSRLCSKERFIQTWCASHDIQVKEIPSETCRLKSFRSPEDLMDWKWYFKVFWHSSGRKPTTWAPARVKGQGPKGYHPLSLQRFFFIYFVLGFVFFLIIQLSLAIVQHILSYIECCVSYLLVCCFFYV